MITHKELYDTVNAASLNRQPDREAAIVAILLAIHEKLEALLQRRVDELEEMG